MDIYRNLQTEVPDTAEMCHAQLIRKTGVTKGAFVDYFIKEKEGNFLEASEVLATDTNRHVLYYGTAISEVAHLKVRLLALRDVRVTDWPLLLPVAWQPARYRVLYLHLPRAVPLSSVSLWAMSGSGQACKISVEPLSVAPE